MASNQFKIKNYHMNDFGEGHGRGVQWRVVCVVKWWPTLHHPHRHLTTLAHSVCTLCRATLSRNAARHETVHSLSCKKNLKSHGTPDRHPLIHSSTPRYSHRAHIHRLITSDLTHSYRENRQLSLETLPFANFGDDVVAPLTCCQ